jgi:serine phosphatase RsbU (regulator of sigma subunit)
VGLAIEVGIAKVNKYASRESGDTAEVVERPGGGISVVVVDGQGSGPAAKSLSMMLTAKAVALLKEGVRDGAVARAVHDTLFAYRGGKVSASLDIVSADLKHGDLVITRNGTSPVIVLSSGEISSIPASEGPIGIYAFTRPNVLRFRLEIGLQAWIVTDGIVGSGQRRGIPAPDLGEQIKHVVGSGLTAEEQAQQLLETAIEADQKRPADDMTVATLRMFEEPKESMVRTLHLVIPTH